MPSCPARTQTYTALLFHTLPPTGFPRMFATRVSSELVTQQIPLRRRIHWNVGLGATFSKCLAPFVEVCSSIYGLQRIGMSKTNAKDLTDIAPSARGASIWIPTASLSYASREVVSSVIASTLTMVAKFSSLPAFYPGLHKQALP